MPPGMLEIYYGDVRAGAIALRSGNPHDTDPWGRSCRDMFSADAADIQTGRRLGPIARRSANWPSRRLRRQRKWAFGWFIMGGDQSERDWLQPRHDREDRQAS
jgi:hypothetical protein